MVFIPNLLYMFEFMVDDMVIIRNNKCAPDDYPTCVEFSFRSNVYVNIFDREYGSCVEPGQPQCGKCCIFPLESPVTDEDRLRIHVYKKRSERCKFLIGLAEVKVKSLFKRVDSAFLEGNEYWTENLKHNLRALPKLKGTNSDFMESGKCIDAGFDQVEYFCPSEITVKQMLPLFNLCQQQTGNMVFVLRLHCHGPTLVSAFVQVGNRNVPVQRPREEHPCYSIPRKLVDDIITGYRYFARNANKLCPCDVCRDEFDRDCPAEPFKKKCKRIVKYRKINPRCRGAKLKC